MDDELPILPSSQIQNLRDLPVRLRALDGLLGSVSLQEQQGLVLEVILSEDCCAPRSQEQVSWFLEKFYYIVNTVPRFDLIPATLVDICRLSWQGRIYENVYRHSDSNGIRDPTYSEVVQLLPRIDRYLKTTLSNKVSAIVGLVSPFRFLDLPTEIRLRIYAIISPRQPYFVLKDVKPRRDAEPRYHLAALRTCWRTYNELINEFYKDETLVMNVYNIFWKHDRAIIATCPRDRNLVLGMRRETRLCFKRLEIRLLDMKDPNSDRKGLYWERSPHDEGWLSDAYETYFREMLEALPNIECATVSFEIRGSQLRYWDTSSRALPAICKYLIREVIERIRLRWDFQPTSHPDQQDLILELIEEGNDIMESVKAMVNKETLKRGGTVELGESTIKEYFDNDANVGYED